MFEEEVKNGVALLDCKIPDWRSKINSDSLDMTSPQFCILGQVFGDYYQESYTYGLFILRIGLSEAHEYGFHILQPINVPISVGFRSLKEEWKKYL